MRIVYKDLGNGTSIKYVMDVNDRPISADINDKPISGNIEVDYMNTPIASLRKFSNYFGMDECLKVERNVELTASDETILF